MNNTPKQPATAILLLNIGSPDSSSPLDVARYLSRFLGDKRIIPLPWFFRKFLVNCIIVPFRCFHSGARYGQLQKLFGGKFPLPYYGEITRSKLQEAFQGKANVFLGMRHGKPTVKEQIETIIGKGYSKVILFPLFPHYASSSTGSVLENALMSLTRYPKIPEIHTIRSFYDHPAFIKAFAERIKEAEHENYEQILFTYHSLPLSQIEAVSGTIFDYEAACKQTSVLIAQELNLPESCYETVFQSQMSGKWLSPFADQTILEKAKNGVQSLLVVAPSFVADCLESSLELGEEYKQMFLQNGGKNYRLVESLNDSDLWISALKQMLTSEMERN